MEKKKIEHIAFIMDGNGRWAKKRGLPRHLGHKAGCDAVTDVYEGCLEKGVKAMSLYAFSTENWNRPKAEIRHLFTYLGIFFRKKIKTMLKDGTRIIVSGDITPLPEKTKETINNAVELTKNGKNFTFNICLNYGSKDEIIRATKKIAKDFKDGKIKEEDITPELMDQNLYTSSLPPVDLLVRTSGEQRLSNYMLWQLAYSEFIFTPVHWPDFNRKELFKCMEEYYTRDRRYGAIVDDGK